MRSYSFGHLSNDVAWSSYLTAESRETADTATTLALLAEVDRRRLYLPGGYGSMCDFCMQARHMSRARALKRIRVARAGRDFPAIFPAIADGRLGLTAVLLLAPHLTPESADELLAVATYKTNEELEQALALRFRQVDPHMALQPIDSEVSAEPVAARRPVSSDEPGAPARMEPILAAPATKHSGWRYAHSAAREEKLRYVQSLLAHARPGAGVDELIDLALDCLKDKLERQKFGKCSRPGRRRGSDNPRHIPVEVKRAVWERDGGRCAFVGTGGKRCDARAPLEFDHVDPVARGGQATVAGIRLLCRAHNQYAADRALGSEFMRGKREQGRERTAKARAEADARAQAKEQEQAQSEAEAASQEELIPWLRALGCNKEVARTTAARCAGMVGAPLERRMFVACQGLAPRGTRRALPVASSPA
jgi:hypothetical protein